MRVVGGKFRGRVLAGPGSVGVAADGGATHLRPTTDRVRESLFNLLAHGPYDHAPEGRRVLDLFAGAGALGLEALSRGATRAVFVEDHGPARALIRANVETLGLGGVTRIWRRNATRLGACRGEPFDLVFVDPPYGKALGGPALESAAAGGWLAAGALIVLELSAREAPPDSLIVHREERYGDTKIIIGDLAVGT